MVRKIFSTDDFNAILDIEEHKLGVVLLNQLQPGFVVHALVTHR